ncbi:alkaline phosphatase [cf. Phormidesmis sp. LEGE 11477]|uniref:alkaline phosphatase D family protein n=1 Tax=cf. Phormidesmis sp. LEGE 11477 TaxID=1828680 RepID=UPI00187FD753|nr:alkaline phosphatase D family protein [cf. Phormidesmis sp. LEGE 11477]MBE9064077.1 alkaline phosphatase D family protein [cf. Phormidesmis sp. LEGE 11477]
MPINNNSTFYLKNVSANQYVVGVEQGRYNWPQLGHKKAAIKLKFIQQRNPQGGTVWKIVSTESSLNGKNVLGAFTDSRDCYYWKDNYDKRKQGWEIAKASGRDGIDANEGLLIRNVSYRQYLVADSKYKGYITTDKAKRDVWSLVPVESASRPSTAKPSAAKPSTSSLDNSKNNSVSANSSQASVQTEKVFQLSVASGDPTENSVILWTRLPDNQQSLGYEVSDTKDFRNIIQSGTVDPSQFGADRDYTVNVDVKELESNKSYFYRFNYGGVVSQIGRCRTLPDPDEDLKSLRLAVVTCNDYSSGYFNAFYKLADADVDFVVHLGDFAYEYSQYPKGYGKRYREEIPFEDTTFRIEEGEDGYEGCDRAYALKDFRQIYQTYRKDKALQKAMENHTWMIMLDDHELADDFYWNYEQNTAGANPSHSIYKKFEQKRKAVKEANLPSEQAQEKLAAIQENENKAMMTLCRNGKQAWREYVPYRPIIDRSFPKDHPNHYRLYRSFKFGKLVNFLLSDSRSYRDRPQLDGVTSKDDLPGKPESSSTQQPSMLGPAQKEWLKTGLKDKEAQWKVWGNQTLISLMLFKLMNRFAEKYDDWHGFVAERYEILQAVKEAENDHNKSENASYFVVLTGDMHTSLISYLKTEFEGKLNKMNLDYSRLAGVEFMTPAITSPGLHEFADVSIDQSVLGTVASGASEMADSLISWWKGEESSQEESSQKTEPPSKVDLISKAVRTFNPQIKDINSEVNGYAIATFTPTDMTWEVFGVDKSAYKETEQTATDGSIVTQEVSTSDVEAETVRFVRYDPSKINLEFPDFSK